VAYPDGLYDDGKIWSPDRDKTYNLEMQLSGATLTQPPACWLAA